MENILKKINIYDIAAIILILVLCVAAYVKFGIIEHTKTEAQMSTIEYTIMFPGLRKYSVDTFKSGDTVYDSQTKISIGTIKAISYENARAEIQALNGEVLEVKNPERYDVTLTIETPGLENDKGYFADRSIELKVGSEKFIETLYIKSNGKIKSIKVK